MIKLAVQKEAFPLAGLLSNVMVQTLAKLSMLSLSKPDIESGSMMTNDDAGNLTKPHIEKCVTGCMEGFIAVTMRGWEGFSVITTRGSQGLSGVTTREELSFETSTRVEFSDSIKKSSPIEATPLILLDSSNLSHVQPFGSMPCCKSSLRANAFSQLPRLTPSRLAASFNCWRNSGVIRIWKVGDRPSPFGVLSLLIVDMYVRNLLVWILLCTYVITAYIKIATPRTVRAAPRRLTKPLIEVTVMAGSQHTQTHPKFTWRFLALNTSSRTVIHIIATTEREARDQSPVDCVMVFAGRLPAQEVSYVA